MPGRVYEARTLLPYPLASAVATATARANPEGRAVLAKCPSREVHQKPFSDLRVLRHACHHSLPQRFLEDFLQHLTYSSRSIKMSFASSNHQRQSSTSTNQPTALINRIQEKRVELANLGELRDLSAQLAAQMQTLSEKVSTLSTGAEAVAAVLSNWHNVLRAINMASAKLPKAIPNQESSSMAALNTSENVDPSLPQTLVRVSIK